MTTPKTARDRRAAQLAELVRQQAELEAQETAYEKAVHDAVRRAGYARAEAVERLYELLGLEEQTTTRTRADGTVQTVRSDRDETGRAQRLVEAVQALLDDRSGTRSAPAEPAGALAPLPPVQRVDEEKSEDEAEPQDGAEPTAWTATERGYPAGLAG